MSKSKLYPLMLTGHLQDLGSFFWRQGARRRRRIMSMASAKTRRSRNDKFNAAEWHRKLITAQRYKPTGSSATGRTIDQESASDRARIIYSSAFRRLQHKTQVFTLSKDAAVRSRLTHSLEVASVGRWIAHRVVDGALQPAGLETIY